MVAVALKNGIAGRGVFHGDERRIGAFPCADKENERFFADEFLVVVKPSDTMMQGISFGDEFGRGFGDNSYKRTPFGVLQASIFLGNLGKTGVQLFALLPVFDNLCSAVFVNTDIVPAPEVAGEKIAFKRHIESQINAGFHIIRIGVDIGVLHRNVSAKVFEISVFEKLFDGGIIFRALKAFFHFVITLQIGERTTAFVCFHNDGNIVIIAGDFGTVFYEPFAEFFVLSTPFQYGHILSNVAESELHQILDLRVCRIEPKIPENIGSVVILECAVTEFWHSADKLQIQRRTGRVVVFIGRPTPTAFVPVSVFLQAFVVPADAEAHSKVSAVFHIFNITF